MNRTQSKSKGFTLIELVIVLVILGILAVVAVPIYIDLTKEAKQKALESVAGSIESAASVYYAAYKLNPSIEHLYIDVGDPCINFWNIPSLGYNGLLDQPQHMQFLDSNGAPEAIQNNGNGTGICYLAYTDNNDNYDPTIPRVPVVFILAS